MRKIHQSVPDVPQAVANKAIDIIERHFTANGVRRAEQLPEESKVHLMRELQKYFQSQAPQSVQGEEGKLTYDWGAEGRDKGFLTSALRWLARLLNCDNAE